MTPQPATQWRPMSEPIMFPALVLYMSELVAIAYSPRDCGTGATHWQPFVPPAPPQRELDAFETWYEDQPIPDNPKTVAQCAWNCSATRERARFSEGVEKWIEKYAHVKYCLGTWCEMGDDLRALAAGKDL